MNVSPKPQAHRGLRALVAVILLAHAGRTAYGEWVNLGTGGIVGGQVEGMESQGNPVSGAVRAIAPHPTNPDVLWLGAVNGGIWRTSNATAPVPVWTPLGDQLSSLSIGALAIDVDDPLGNTLLAGFGRASSLSRTGGFRDGVVRSVDGGATWAALGGLTLTGANVSGIVANGDTILVAVNTADTFSFGVTGIYRSADGGATFAHLPSTVGSGLPTGVSYDIRMNPLDPSDIVTSIALGPAANGIWRSHDGGGTWGKISDAAVDATFGASTSNVKLSFGNAGQVYAGVVNSGRVDGLFRLGAGDTSWQALDLPVTTEPGGSVGLNPDSDEEPATAPPAEIAGGQGSLHFSLVADPVDANVVYVGGDRQPGPGEGGIEDWPNSLGAENYSGRLFRIDAAAAAGAQASPLTHRGGSSGNTSTLSNSSPHADSRALAFDAAGRLLEADDGGIYLRTMPRTDNAGDWSSLNGSLVATEYHSVAWDHVAGVFIGGTQDVGTPEQLAANSTVLRTVTQGDGGEVAVQDLGDGTSLRYSSYYSLYGLQVRHIDAANVVLGSQYVATDGIPDEERQFYTPIAVDPRNGQLFAGGKTNVWVSSDHGDTFTAIADSSDAPVSVIAAGDAGSPGSLWVGRGDHLRYDTTLSGCLEFRASAVDAITVVNGYGGTQVVDLAVDPSDQRRLVATDITSVRFTQDGGATFADITGDLFSFGGREVWSLELLHEDGVDVVFAGLRSGGVWFTRSTSGLGHWFALGGIAGAPVRDLDYDPTDDILLAGLQGRGAWAYDGVSLVVVPEPGTLLAAGAAMATMLVCRRGKHSARRGDGRRG